MKIKAVKHERTYQSNNIIDYDILEEVNEEGWKVYIDGEKYPIGRGAFYPLILTEEGKKEAIKTAIKQLNNNKERNKRV